MKLNHVLTVLLTVAALLAGARAFAQDTPTDIPKSELPKKAVCAICSLSGEEHGEEGAAAGVRYKGKAYYFCNKGEVATFKKDPEAYVPPVLPRSAPALSVKTLEGAKTGLADYKGKVVLVDFWATWCKPCVAVMPDLQKLHDKYAGKGFSMVGVSIDEDGAKTVKPWLAKRKFSYPILLDEAKVWQMWKVHSIPAMFLIDKDGQIVRQWTGRADKKEVEKAIADQLAK
jgi:peroxiredoxin/YHS domain-containing protein